MGESSVVGDARGVVVVVVVVVVVSCRVLCRRGLQVQGGCFNGATEGGVRRAAREGEGRLRLDWWHVSRDGLQVAITREREVDDMRGLLVFVPSQGAKNTMDGSTLLPQTFGREGRGLLAAVLPSPKGQPAPAPDTVAA
ncbi:hypothetical protein P280DRAFT_470901 [Massarina eburnea CBS 473.64]|uniref:Uncharacterized protein n=1 Tax=Massarina eburnea CBS 473.64 TaxID=1395130 RepID=A0A6A6RTN2_9PLEO|nr:hypothetical protein P280DRAFT_470901 [Massarina eburnea CBS 473.64]